MHDDDEQNDERDYINGDYDTRLAIRVATLYTRQKDGLRRLSALERYQQEQDRRWADVILESGPRWQNIIERLATIDSRFISVYLLIATTALGWVGSLIFILVTRH